MASRPTPAEILNRFYEAETLYMASAPSERDFSNTMGVHVSPDIHLFQSPDLPWGGDYQGHAGFQKWSEAMGSYFSSLEVLEPKVFEKDGADEVVVTSTLKLTVKGDDKQWIAPLVQVMKVDREKEWIVEIRPMYWNVAGLRELLGL